MQSETINRYLGNDYGAEAEMRSLIAIIVIVYLVGVGVMLAPTFEAKWNTGTASDLFNATLQELPSALAWPARQYHRFMDAPAHTEATVKP